MPNATTSSPPMTETIDSANAAASTLFLGQNGEWWDFWLIMSLIAVALAAIAAGVTTTGSIVSHKREAASAEMALERFKLQTEQKISEADARAAEAKVALEKYKQPRNLDVDSFLERLKGVPPAKVQVLYVRECTDCAWVAQFITSFLETARWESGVSPIDEAAAATGPFRQYSSPLSVRAYPWGITILAKDVSPEVFDSPKGASLKALFDALLKSFHPSVSMAFDKELADGLLRVVVAPKP
jgi:hypothetical protein